MDIYLEPKVRYQMRDANVSCLKAARIVKRGTQAKHPSGALAYSHNGNTLVGIIVDNVFRAFRFYN